MRFSGEGCVPSSVAPAQPLGQASVGVELSQKTWSGRDQQLVGLTRSWWWGGGGRRPSVMAPKTGEPEGRKLKLLSCHVVWKPSYIALEAGLQSWLAFAISVCPPASTKKNEAFYSTSILISRRMRFPLTPRPDFLPRNAHSFSGSYKEEFWSNTPPQIYSDMDKRLLGVFFIFWKWPLKVWWVIWPKDSLVLEWFGQKTPWCFFYFREMVFKGHIPCPICDKLE